MAATPSLFYLLVWTNLQLKVAKKEGKRQHSSPTPPLKGEWAGLKSSPGEWAGPVRSGLKTKDHSPARVKVVGAPEKDDR